jgi:hypothetical protein
MVLHDETANPEAKGSVTGDKTPLWQSPFTNDALISPTDKILIGRRKFYR